MHSNVSNSWVPAYAPLPRGRTESVAPHANTYSIVKQPIGFERIALSQKKIGRCRVDRDMSRIAKRSPYVKSRFRY